jgi:glycosyltransferase involved in cell wall biosynthesis
MTIARAASATSSPVPAEGYGASLELTVVMPCLNEAATIGRCVEKALRTMQEHGIRGEVVVADNGSTDGSVEMALSQGARVVPVAERGYGNALMGGITAALGRYVLMGDADESYDFTEIPRFLAPLNDGAELVQGCRLPAGGGTIRPGAMRLLHRVWGNPMLSALARSWFHAPIHDVYCGMRAFRVELPARLDLRCTGMEFALEMIIKATLTGASIREVPITLWPDGREGRPSHLRTFRDGWRSLRFFLLFSPRWLFLVPGAVLALLGVLGYAIALPQAHLGRVEFGVHTLLVASLMIICGFQAFLFAFLTKTFAITEGLLPTDHRMVRLFEIFTLERGLLAGAVATLGGISLICVAVAQWAARDFGPLDYSRTMRWVIPGTLLVTLGVQAVLSSFFFSILGLKRR